MLAAYVGLSRVKSKEALLIMQAFSPALFAHGPPPGPHILMRLLRGEVPVEEIDEEFWRLEREAKWTGAEKDLMHMRWECALCKMEGRDYQKPMEDFGVRKEADFLGRLLPQGAWARCTACAKRRRGLFGRAGAVAGGNTNNPVNQMRMAASPAMATCIQCDIPKRRLEFWPGDWLTHRARGIFCMECQPLHPRERRQKYIKCVQCGADKQRSKYWAEDLKSRHLGIRCKACRPVNA